MGNKGDQPKERVGGSTQGESQGINPNDGLLTFVGGRTGELFVVPPTGTQDQKHARKK